MMSACIQQSSGFVLTFARSVFSLQDSIGDLMATRFCYKSSNLPNQPPTIYLDPPSTHKNDGLPWLPHDCFILTTNIIWRYLKGLQL